MVNKIPIYGQEETGRWPRGAGTGPHISTMCKVERGKTTGRKRASKGIPLGKCEDLQKTVMYYM